MKLNLKEGYCPVKEFAHFLQEFRATTAKLAAIGSGISEADQASALLSSLPDSFSPLIMSPSSTTIDQSPPHVTTMIEQEVQRRKEEKRGVNPIPTSFNTALNVNKSNRSRVGSKCNCVSTRSTY
jgi:gag-polypeptide of LTR copia-type